MLLHNVTKPMRKTEVARESIAMEPENDSDKASRNETFLTGA